MSVKPDDPKAGCKYCAQYVAGFLSGASEGLRSDLTVASKMLEHLNRMPSHDQIELAKLIGRVDALEQAIKESESIKSRLVESLNAR